MVLFIFPLILDAAECMTGAGNFIYVDAYDLNGDGNTIRVEARAMGGGTQCECYIGAMRIFDWGGIPATNFEYRVIGKIGWTPLIEPVDYKETITGNDLDCETPGGKLFYTYAVDFNIDSSTWPDGTYTVELRAFSVEPFSKSDNVTLVTICECSSSDGPCCSNDCDFDPSSVVCGSESDHQCTSSACGADYQRKTRDVYCPGNAATCTGSPGTWSGWSTVQDCDDDELCYTSGIKCRFDASCVPNQPPNTPTLIAPPHNTWINYNPTFKARVSDPDNDDVRAYFNVSGYGNGWGNWVANGGTSQWGPVNLGTCSQYWWRAYAQDTNSTNSPWSGYWKVRVDKDNPIGDISYPNGEINSLSFDVSLTESDTCSGINQGKVEIKTKAPGTGWGDWKPYDTTIDDFTFTGQDGYSYWFRYQVKDNANNWSDPVQGGDVTIKLNKAPQATNLQRIDPDWCAKPPGYFFSWIYSDPDEDTEKRFDFQIDNNSNFSSPEIDRTYDNLSNPSPSQNTQSVLVAVSSSLPDYLTYNQTYYWRARVWDSKGANSGWVNNGSFTTQP
ncbi:MAG: hypothetical protein ACTSSP_06180, partial [Candidatus Asgardarchaeia archaeon]